MHNLETIWKEYDTFENELNKQLAKPLLAEQAPKYMQARTIYRERKRFYEGILRNMLATPPCTGDKELHQVISLL
jgi:cleavage stimulation factor subunit 3